MSSKNARYKLAKILSQDISNFGECFGDYFLCPTCMKPFHVKQDIEKYTAGHIVPESAGGSKWTILCQVCNNRFGALQDNWFGEYLCVTKNPEATFLHAKSKSKYISVNGVNVSARIGISEEDRAVEIFIPINQNPPGKVESISYGAELEVQFVPEITKHINEVQVGYITAAYLTWFNVVGYSWAMQSSLEFARKQILNCDYALDGAKVVDLHSDSIFEPDIGVIIESGHAYPCCLMYDRVVIFPSPNVSKAPTPKNIEFTSNYQVNLLNLGIMNVPYSVNFEGKILVFPDMLRKEPSIPKHMLYMFADSAKESQWLSLEM